jgi:hypothetical protein
VVCAAGLLCCPAMPRQHPSAVEQPEQFEVGVRTYFDFGPPFDYYEIFLVRPAPTGTSVERINLTPEGTECGAPFAKVETASGSLADSIAKLMGSRGARGDGKACLPGFRTGRVAAEPDGFGWVERRQRCKYDDLFPSSTDKMSELYRSAQIHPAPPTVRLVSSSVPMPAETFTLPEYSLIARAGGVEGRV